MSHDDVYFEKLPTHVMSTNQSRTSKQLAILPSRAAVQTVISTFQAVSPGDISDWSLITWRWVWNSRRGASEVFPLWNGEGGGRGQNKFWFRDSYPLCSPHPPRQYNDQSLILEDFEGLVVLSLPEMRQELYEFVVSGKASIGQKFSWWKNWQVEWNGRGECIVVYKIVTKLPYGKEKTIFGMK